MVKLGILLIAFGFSTLVIAGMAGVARRLGMTDAPGGHKLHERPVPVVGGSGIYVVVVLMSAAAWWQPAWRGLFLPLALASTLVFAVGLADDFRPLRVATRFGAQALAATLAALWGGLVLNDIGALWSSQLVYLGALAVPLTVFAWVGVVNAVNMTDGIDGLSGMLTLITLVFLAIIARSVAAAAPYLFLVYALIGAVCGFLVFNLRCCGRKKAAVFLGDAGSTLLGFLLAALLIGLSQEPVRAMSPVVALWLCALPLFDTVTTILRRLWLGKSPFLADRSHLHHLLLDAGYSVTQSVTVLSLLHTLAGAVGLLGWRQALPDRWLFVAYLVSFAVYFYLSSRPWRLVPALRSLHEALGLTRGGVTELFIGHLPEEGAEALLRELLGERAERCQYRLYAYEDGATGRRTVYAVAPVGFPGQASRMIRDIKARLPDGEEIVVRQFVPRSAKYDRRRKARGANGADRRQIARQTLILDKYRDFPVSRGERPPLPERQDLSFDGAGLQVVPVVLRDEPRPNREES